MSTLVDILTELDKYKSININRITVHTKNSDYYTNVLYEEKQKIKSLHENNILIDNAIINIRKTIKNG